VHTDLFANGNIPDPFIGTNEAKVQWVETKTWEYQASFSLSKQQLRERHLELEFDGLDTYADVYLNGQLLFTAEDMFLKYVADIKPYAKLQNTIRVVFHPAQELIEKNKARSPVKTYPGGDRVFIRKAQYQFGWDWGPRLVTCGIWKPVRVTGWSDLRISDVVYKLDYLDKDTAFMTVDFTFEADRSGAYRFTVSQNDTTTYSDLYSVTKRKPEHLKITFRIAHPQLWWCNGMGAQPLYKFSLTASRKKKTSTVHTVTGIRKIELSTDQMNKDGSFTFILNDRPVFAMGPNWIPSDNFLPRVTDAKISSQLTDMRDLNMNMVRVWGGGIYESDHFYSKCDSLGLMVWQDLPFACSMYPYEVLDKNNLLVKEVTANVRRIASHPSVAIWCGDNENKEGWFNWGWQKQFRYSSADSAKIYNDYINYSLKFMGCVAQHDPFFPYVTTSPQNGWGRDAAYLRGDVHYWGVWWGMEPFSSYEDHTGRFVSEFGFQGAPSLHTFREMGANVSKWFADSTIINHQKHPTGYQTIETYMKRDYGITPNSFEDYVYLSQVLQKGAMTTAIEAQRRNFPVCTGSLFWQYNDCWPVTSWSVQDYYGRKKLAWHALKRLYQPFLMSIEETGDSVFVWVINNSANAYNGQLKARWQDFTSAPRADYAKEINVKAHSSVRYALFAKSALFDALKPADGILTATFMDYLHSSVTGADEHIFGKEIDHNYPVAEPKYSFVRYIREGPMAISVFSPVYIRNVMITCDDPNTTFSQNGFDLFPGSTVLVKISTSKTEAEIKESLRFHSMNRLVNAEKADSKNELPD
jgi:beta-mannosidase